MTTPKNEALAVYLAACEARRQEIVAMHKKVGTYATAKYYQISRQRVQAVVQTERKRQKPKP